jgi:hypothetical protein
MKLVVLVAFAFAVLASPALAKGPSEVSIEGPGLSEPIMIELGELGLRPGSPLMEFSENVGFFDVVFRGSRAERPAGDLGPRYLVTYLVPGPEGEEFVLEQDLYPYAEAGPVSYLAPGQQVYARNTAGGWFVGGAELKDMLMVVGLPATPPSAPDSQDFPWILVVLLGALGTTLVLGSRLARRRVPSFDA